jgi:GTP-binding protein HflX
LVGYTNAGKSTLLNHLTQSDVMAEDKLFATLDPVTRRFSLPEGRAVLAVDTVGFINKLPHDLVDAFRSTLEEAAYADVLIHVVDASSEQMMMHYKVVNEVLASLGAGEKPTVIALNKSDIAGNDQIMLTHEENAVKVSALTGVGINDLLTEVEELLNEGEEEVDVIIPYEHGALSSKIFDGASKIIEQEYVEGGTRIRAIVPHGLAKQVDKELKEKAKTK